MPSAIPTILIVEDDSDIALLTCRAIRKIIPLCELCHVPDGRMAIRWLLQFPTPTLMITDLQMPVVDGLQLLVWVRERPELSFPIIVQTGSTDPMNEQRCREQRIESYLLKNGEPTELCDKVRSLFAKEEQPSPVLEVK